MPKKNTIDESNEEHVENQQEEFIEQPAPKKKKAHEVVLVGKTRVVYKVSDKLGNSTTPDIWNGKLKVGDTIYLDEE